MSASDLDNIRQGALERIDKSRKSAIAFLVAAGVFEAGVLLIVLMTMDFDDTTHLLIFLCACLVYCPLAFGLFALRAFIDMSAERVLRAIELLGEES